MNGNTKTSFVLPLNGEQVLFANALYSSLEAFKSNESFLEKVVDGDHDEADCDTLSASIDLKGVCPKAVLDCIHYTFKESGTLLDDFDQFELFNIKRVIGGLKFYGEEFLEDFLAYFVKVIIERFDLPPKAFSIAYSDDKYIEDEFGGMAFCISKDGIRSMNLQDWMDEALDLTP